MYSLGVFNEGGGSYTASMPYLDAQSKPQPRVGGQPQETAMPETLC